MTIGMPRTISAAVLTAGMLALSLTGAGAAIAGTAVHGLHPSLTQVFHATGTSPQQVVNATEGQAKRAGFSLSQCTGTLMEIDPFVPEWEATLTCTS